MKLFIRMVVCALVFVTGRAWAWDIPIVNRHLIGTNLSGTFLTGLTGDVDRDGDPDVFIRTTQTNLVWLENIDAATSNWVGSVIETNTRPIAVADFDDDGDLDVASFRSAILGERIFWHENNDGAGGSWTTRVVDSNLLAGAVVFQADASDYDRDGAPDLVVAFQNAGHPVYRYVKNGASWTRHIVFTNNSFRTGDLDRDGDPDLLSAKPPRVSWYENRGSAMLSNWPEVVIATDRVAGTIFSPFDPDSDGDLDVAVGASPAGWYVNDGTGTAWTFQAQSALQTSFEEMRALDFDGDGDEDLLLDDVWFDNPGRTAGPWREHDLGNLFSNSLTSLDVADFDGDGDVDVLASAQSNQLHWLEIRAPSYNLAFRSAWTISTNLLNTTDLDAADLDRDGDVDLAAASTAGKLVWFANTGPGTGWTERIIASNAVYDFYAVAVGDLDADGDPDVAANTYAAPAELNWYENLDGLAGAWLTHTVAVNAFSINDVLVAPLSPDAAPDIAASMATDQDIRWWRNQNGTGTNFIALPVSNDIDTVTGLDLGDINRDGSADLVAALYNGSRLAWFDRLGGAGGSNWTINIIATNYSSPTDVVATDFDGDGDLDVAAVSYNGGTVNYFRNLSGDGTNWSSHVVATNRGRPLRVTAGDFNRDGKPDIAATEFTSNRVTVYFNTGLPAVWLPAAGALTTAQPVVAADFDDDGNLDVAAAAGNSRSVVWFEKAGAADLAASMTRPALPVNFGAAFTFTLRVTNNGPNEASSVVLTNTLPGEVYWVSDSCGIGPPAGSNLTWNIGTLAPYQAVTCTVNVISFTGTVDVVVTSRVAVSHDAVDPAASNNLVLAAVTIGDLAGLAVSNFSASLVAVGHLDQNGEPDMVAASTASNRVRFVYNRIRDDGPGGDWQEGSTLTIAGPTALAVADLNRDGFGDPIVGSSGAEGLLWISLPATNLKRYVSMSSTGIVAIAPADLDGDGDLDLLVANDSTDRIQWFANENATGTVWTTNTIATGLADPASVAAADLDDDGDLDALYAVRNGNRIVWRENVNGDGLTWLNRPLDTAVTGALRAVAADVDRDGDLDVVGAGTFAAWWENRGTNWVKRTIDPATPGLVDFSAIDFDRDGDVDAVACFGTNSAQLVWWDNVDGLGRAWTERTVSGTAAGVVDMELSDMDGDGGVDVAGAQPGALRAKWWAGTPPPWPADFSGPAGRVLATNMFETYTSWADDLDNDGDVDIVAGWTTNKTIRWWKNLDGRFRAWAHYDVTIQATGVLDLVTGDFDRDGDVDIASLGQDISWWSRVSDTHWTRHIVLEDWQFFGGKELATADMDQDGDLDLVFTWGNASEGYVTLLRNADGAGGSWLLTHVETNLPNAHPLDLGDFNGDGKPDIVAAADQGALHWYANQGQGLSYSNLLLSAGTGDRRLVVSLADVDRDGFNDVIYGDGNWLRLITHLPPLTNLIYSTFGFMPDTPTVAEASDVDGDGDLDLFAATYDFGASPDDRVVWFENITTSILNFVSHTIESNMVGVEDGWAGDLDRDGDPDLVVSANKISSFSSSDLEWWENRFDRSLVARKQPSTLQVGGPTSLVWTLSISNQHTVTATGVTVTDYLPGQVIWVTNSCGLPGPAAGVWTWNVGSLAAGASAFCTVTVQVVTGNAERIVNVIQVRANIAGQSGTNDFALGITEVSDFDRDGWLDEVDPDDDNDGMPDLFENLHGFNPYNPVDANADADGDSILNLFEYIADTIPTNAGSFLRISGASNAPPLRVVFSGSASRVYTFQFTTNLLGGGWSNLAGQVDIPGSGSGQTFSDTNATPARNYRVQVELP
jgi:uncharacterized repeat protein (TIGR01451 family)